MDKDSVVHPYGRMKQDRLDGVNELRFGASPMPPFVIPHKKTGDLYESTGLDYSVFRWIYFTSVMRRTLKPRWRRS